MNHPTHQEPAIEGRWPPARGRRVARGKRIAGPSAERAGRDPARTAPGPRKPPGRPARALGLPQGRRRQHVRHECPSLGAATIRREGPEARRSCREVSALDPIDPRAAGWAQGEAGYDPDRPRFAWVLARLYGGPASSRCQRRAGRHVRCVPSAGRVTDRHAVPGPRPHPRCLPDRTDGPGRDRQGDRRCRPNRPDPGRRIGPVAERLAAPASRGIAAGRAVPGRCAARAGRPVGQRGSGRDRLPERFPRGTHAGRGRGDHRPIGKLEAQARLLRWRDDVHGQRRPALGREDTRLEGRGRRGPRHR